MKMQHILDEIKLAVTGGILELEIEDKDIKRIVKMALREVERYCDETDLITIPFASCIDFSKSKIDVSSVTKIYRTTGYGIRDEATAMSDPMFAQQWLMFSNGGTMYNVHDYLMNYAAWNTMLQIKNTLSTDLAFKEDRHNNKLYINCAFDKPELITIEYVPKFKSVEDIKSDYWIDILIKISIALTKIALGRIRTRYTQSGALWTQDGEKILEEGNTELKDLRDTLQTHSNLIYGID